MRTSEAQADMMPLLLTVPAFGSKAQARREGRKRVAPGVLRFAHIPLAGVPYELRSVERMTLHYIRRLLRPGSAPAPSELRSVERMIGAHDAFTVAEV